MDRLTTGRRHVRAGSVSVTELISRQAAEPESPTPEPAETTVTLDGPVEPEAGPTSHRRPSSRAAQLAKITSLAVATLVLCGAIGVASTIAHRREAAEPAPERPAEISGEQALMPGELDRTLAPTRATAARPPSPKPVTTTPRVAAPPAASASTPMSGTTASDSSTTVAPQSDVDVVKKFYDVVPTDPALAFDLLAPGLLDSTLGQFLDSWSLVRSVDVVGIEKRADGVLAMVRLRLANGGQLQLQQLLTVAESPRRIVGVRLLSAQRN
ncbi:hypothetical protein [Actinophytocola sp.]|uniref:hypothetical protein n=1 Tax=Actinophytocola sp. TaxID=1872138 RepID=UPI003D6A2DD6